MTDTAPAQSEPIEPEEVRAIALGLLRQWTLRYVGLALVIAGLLTVIVVAPTRSEAPKQFSIDDPAVAVVSESTGTFSPTPAPVVEISPVHELSPLPALPPLQPLPLATSIAPPAQPQPSQHPATAPPSPSEPTPTGTSSPPPSPTPSPSPTPCPSLPVAGEVCPS